MGLITQTSASGIVSRILVHLPPKFIVTNGNKLYNFLMGIASGFAEISTNQINQLYDRIFIGRASSGDLEQLISDYSGIRRKNGEIDSDYINRYYKYVFEYNITTDKINEIVYDITGDYPTRLFELTDRSAYWGLENLTGSAIITGTSYFYNDVNEFTPNWGDDASEGAFIGYIYLIERPSFEQLNDLCYVLNAVRMTGTTIYLVIPSGNDVFYDDISPYDDIYNYS